SRASRLLELRALERRRRPVAARLAFEVDRALPLIERIAVALGDHADLRHRPLVQPEPLRDLAVAEAAAVDTPERGRQRQHLVLGTRINPRVQPKKAHCISLSPWAAGHARMHSKHCAMLVDEYVIAHSVRVMKSP